MNSGAIEYQRQLRKTTADTIGGSVSKLRGSLSNLVSFGLRSRISVAINTSRVTGKKAGMPARPAVSAPKHRDAFSLKFITLILPYFCYAIVTNRKIYALCIRCLYLFLCSAICETAMTCIFLKSLISCHN